jgi:predicted XRE-type DNA-binding protein
LAHVVAGQEKSAPWCVVSLHRQHRNLDKVFVWSTHPRMVQDVSANMAKRPRIRLTRELAAKIKRLALDTDLLQHEIAASLSINQGRVSEVLNNKRFAEVPPA